MRIKEIRCDQFAGIHDREYDFEKGLNLIIGDNETGKSTIVDLLYYLFFQNANINGIKDKDFKEKYFPKNTGAYQGDVIDGEIRFETKVGTYRLTKEWSRKNGTAKLRLPDGNVIHDEDTIRSILADALAYGKGVYDELVFASQRRPQTILRGLLSGDPSANVKELAAAVSKEVMEIGGIDVDKMEDKLRETVRSYEGRWDFAVGKPEDGNKRGIKNPWKNGVGSILEAYYKKEEITAKKEAAEEAERKVDCINADIRAAKLELESFTSRRERFAKVRRLLSEQNSNKELLDKEEAELRTMQNVLSDWPTQSAQISNAKKLQKQLQQALVKELYETVHGLIESRDETQDKLDQTGPIEQKDIDDAVAAEYEIRTMESVLKGMNLTARIRKLGPTDIQIKSAASGASIPNDSDEIEITEAVDISIPDIAEIRLAPKGVDVDSVKSRLTTARETLSAILNRYDVLSVEELKEKQKEEKTLKENLDWFERKIQDTLGDVSWENLRSDAASVPDGLPSKKDITQTIADLCGKSSVDAYIGGLETLIAGHEKTYGSIEKLSADMKEKKDKVTQRREKIKHADSVPEEFQDIADPDEYDEALRGKIESLQAKVDTLKDNLSAAKKVLQEKSAEEYEDERNRAESDFEAQKAEYARWKHILEVFEETKTSTKDTPLADVKKYFCDNLSMLSGGKIVLEEIGDDLGSSITSGNNRLTADILSDGTKDTIALAFRLAVLKHLFPAGGCVAVFDDPFTDMDPTRTEQACRMLQKFAEDNQVIFVSCDDKYKKLLTGNIISISA